MTGQESAWQSVEATADALAPEADKFASVDMVGFGESTLAVLMRAAGKPGDVASAVLEFWASVARIGPVAAARWLGSDAEPPVPVQDDKRFDDRSWHDNPAFFAIRQAYLAAVRLTGALRVGCGVVAGALRAGNALRRLDQGGVARAPDTGLARIYARHEAG